MGKGGFLIGWWLVSCAWAHGQSAPDCDLVIRGQVNDTQSKIHLIGGAVCIRELGRAVSANEAGEYAVQGLCPGTYTVVCSYVGHETDTATVTLRQAPVVLNFDLREEKTILNAVTVTGRPTAAPTQAVGTLEGVALDQTRGASLGESLKDIPGVSSLQTGPSVSKPVIQGLHSNRILILNNGIRQEGQQWGSEHAPEIDPFVATKLSVVKGAAAVRYGTDAIGGVILVEPPALRREAGLRGEVNAIGMTNGRGGVTSATLEGGSRKLVGLGWRAQGTFKRLGDSEAARYVLSNTGLREINFSGALGYGRDRYAAELFYSRFSTDLGILRSAHVGSLGDLERAIEGRQPAYVADFTHQINNPKQRISHDLLKLKAHYDLRAGKLSLQYGGQFNSRREFDLRRGGRSEVAALDLALITHTLDVVFEHQPWKTWRGSVGIQGVRQDNTNVVGTGIRPLIPQYRSTGLGVFWVERRVREKTELEVGVRYDHRLLDVLRFDRTNNLLNPRFNFNNVSGTLGAVYNPHPSLSLRTNLASAWRPPNVAELYSEGLHHGTGTIEEGDENLRTEKAYKWINTLTYSTIPAEGGKGVALEASAYYNYLRNYIFLEPIETRFTIRGAFPVFRYHQTNVTFTGLDASLRWFFTTNLSFQSKASLVRAKDVSRNGFVSFIPADRFENALTYQPGVGKWKDLYVSFGIVSVSQQFRAPPVFTIAQVRQAATDDSVVIPNQTFDFVAAPAGYWLLNLHVGFTLPVASQKLSVHAGVNNLLNAAYRDYMNRFRYFSDAVGRNFTLRLKYAFDFPK